MAAFLEGTKRTLSFEIITLKRGGAQHLLSLFITNVAQEEGRGGGI